MSKQSKHSSPEQLFSEVSNFISESRSLLEQGAMMDMHGFDERVKTLCDSVMKLSQDERIIYADKLQALFDDLKLLGEGMVNQRDAMADMIRDLSSHKKASVAYRTVDNSDRKKTDE